MVCGGPDRCSGGEELILSLAAAAGELAIEFGVPGGV